MESQRSSSRIARNGFLDIAAQLRDDIATGQIMVGSYLPTERELQTRFGASRATIRKALASLTEWGWGLNVPNRGVVAARGLRLTCSNEIAFIDGGVGSKLLESDLSERLSDRGFRLVRVGGTLEDSIEDSIQRAIDMQVAAALVWPFRGFPDNEQIRQLAFQIPIVALDHGFHGVDVDLATFNHEAAGQEATTHLIAQGCRRIGVSGMLDMQDITHSRFRGYMRALFANELQPLPRDFLFNGTSGRRVQDTTALELCFRSGDRPDGLVVLQDEFLPSVVESALRCGLSLPNDLKIIAIGDEIDLRVDQFGMTAVDMDWSNLADAAIELLQLRLENLHRPPQTLLASHQLVVRGLCGAPEPLWDERASADEFTSQLVPKSRYRYNNRWVYQH